LLQLFTIVRVIMLLKVILLYPFFPLLVNVARSMIQVVSLLDG